MESMFRENQIVWAKINGYPWWPAYVKCEPKASQLEVVFFGDFSRAVLHKSKVRVFDEVGCRANSRNKVLNDAVKSAERVFNSEALIIDEWQKINKSVLTKYPMESERKSKKPPREAKRQADDASVSLSNHSKAKYQETVTKVESEEQPDFKYCISDNNHNTTSTYNHFIDNKALVADISAIEELLEDFWLNLRHSEYEADSGITCINDIVNKVLTIDPKVIFPSSVGSLFSSCINVCKAKTCDESYKRTLDALTSSINQICEFLISEGFLMESKVTNDYIDFSKRNSIMMDGFPDLGSPVHFELHVSPVFVQLPQVDTVCEQPVFEQVGQSDVLEVEDRVQFRVKKKLAKLIYSDNHKETLKKRVCEEVARHLEQAMRRKSRTLAEYKEEVLNTVKVIDRDHNRLQDIVLGYQAGKKIEIAISEINKLANR